MKLQRLFMQSLKYLKKVILVSSDKIGIINCVYYIGNTPYRKYDGDAGYDLFVSKECIIKANSYAVVDVNTIITSRRLWFLLTGRSSNFKKRGLLVNESIIDNGYDGTMDVIVQNLNNFDVTISVGERVCQVIPFKLIKTYLVDNLKISGERCGNGFGSTGI